MSFRTSSLDISMFRRDFFGREEISAARCDCADIFDYNQYQN